MLPATTKQRTQPSSHDNVLLQYMSGCKRQCKACFKYLVLKIFCDQYSDKNNERQTNAVRDVKFTLYDEMYKVSETGSLMI